MKDLVRDLAGALAATGIERPEQEARALVRAAAAAADPAAAARALVRRRLAGEPLGYLTGSVVFMGVELLCEPGALAPREETELLGRTALEVLRASFAHELRMIDMCCGAGNLACAIARHMPAVRVWASDLTRSCAQLTARNARHTGVGARVVVRCGDLFQPLSDEGLEGLIDVVVCNPPYISRKRLAADRVGLLRYEPREAFDGGGYGFSIHQRVAREARSFLKPGGTLLFEVGLHQDRQVRALFERTGGYEDIRSVRNPAGEVRVVTGRKGHLTPPLL
jgi:release factor glutamine methyltransferase